MFSATPYLIPLFIAFSSFTLSAKPKSEINPQAILEKAEFIRNPSEDYVCNVELTDKKNQKKDLRTYETLIKGRDKALVKFLTPVTEVGTRVLMVESDMWIYVPSSAKPVRISANQKLTGNAAYGDVARLSFLGNYTAKFNRHDRLVTTEAIVLDLTSIEDRQVTYDNIEYWIDAKTFRPLKTLYKTASGKVIREGSYADYKDVLGVLRPTKFILKNSLHSDHVTTLVFQNPRRQAMSDLLFAKQNLGRQ